MKVDILAFAAHPDDIEISASGTLMKHIDAGKKVVIVDLTEGELGSRGNRETRYQEAAKASKLMGITERCNLNLGDGFFELNEKNKIKVVEQIRKYQPEIVICNAIDDRHPDHGRASKLVSDACFLAGLLKIETHLNGQAQKPFRPKAVYHYIQDRYIKPDFVVDITQYADKKIEVLKCFETQFYQADSKEPRTPISGPEFFDFLKGRWLEFGRSINVNYGEGFLIERPIGIDDITIFK